MHAPAVSPARSTAFLTLNFALSAYTCARKNRECRSHVVIFRDPPLDVITLVTSAEAVCTFVLYVSRPSAAATAAASNGATGNARAIAESPATAAAVAGAAASSVRV